MYNVKYRPTARKRLGKHIPVEACSRNDGPSIDRQRISKQAFLTIERLYFLRGLCRRLIKGQRRSLEVVVENWVEYWRWQSKVIEQK
jgi:hypothetical protein